MFSVAGCPHHRPRPAPIQAQGNDDVALSHPRQIASLLVIAIAIAIVIVIVIVIAIGESMDRDQRTRD
ncbi:hypothetical protein [Lysobacter sp. CA196]|uniref:hypothetical protein n=1 Tax=Lysobacter sp. CA196 TaxID=3455606 RepID=UPI003F8D5F54